MQRTIWKFTVSPYGIAAVQMPVGATVVAVEAQGHTPTLWAVVDPDAPTEERLFVVLGTGHYFDGAECKHVGTFHQPPFVWHVMEKFDSTAPSRGSEGGTDGE